ncbi:VOC family protein [Microbacterium hydrocarbonoxydans]|jgi:predicted 3-demethylubiquinone-9 3-methyltransferase (glyoxalase superfamily)|uniref:Glyoxalase superfamily enzyme, possibly 3-demethylubiquinone-9 3-methyltransferase n=1 Tax=Microbacterium hydrocarbonoxydans TaxID=273678 RepID=A0A1H4J867_9MICO|nr:VOC family protein [Microbacterium hydrocarbonoxydans]SEB42391.1 Glyoxalase superfamily enzyme, possibly 3-demethylubiquinone-9 3-methyltransferase [Microbacterium hydrocarbonoxydans]
MADIRSIRPFLWFDGRAQEAMEYYVSVFPNSSIDQVVLYPDESLDRHFEGMTGKVLTGEFTLNGTPFGCLDGGPQFTFNESISFVIGCDDQAEIDHYWAALSAVPDAEACGWCKDRFGVSWQVVPAGFDLLQQRPEQIQALMHMKKIVIAELENA